MLSSYISSGNPDRLGEPAQREAAGGGGREGGRSSWGDSRRKKMVMIPGASGGKDLEIWTQWSSF